MPHDEVCSLCSLTLESVSRALFWAHFAVYAHDGEGPAAGGIQERQPYRPKRSPPSSFRRQRGSSARVAGGAGVPVGAEGDGGERRQAGGHLEGPADVRCAE